MVWTDVLKFKRNHPPRYSWVQQPPKSWQLLSIHTTKEEAMGRKDRKNEWYVQHGEAARGMVRQLSNANSDFGELWGVFRKGKYSGRSYPDSHKV
tara:strand:+ start:336 stop:620 length:285 start_codon:yes stop_codon:yes gene_type:complete